MNLKISVILTFLILVLVNPLSAQKGKWKKTQKINTIETYQDFIKTFPQSEFYKEARSKLFELEYTKAINTNTIESLEYYVNNYADSKFYNEVFDKLIGLEWNLASKENTHQSLNSFIEKYPNSKLKEDAFEKIEELDYQLALDRNNLEAYNSFLQVYPNSKFFTQINHKVDSIIFEQLIYALKVDNIDSLSLIIPSIKNLNTSLNKKAAPIFYAKCKESLELLLSNNADINYLNNAGQNCLFYALDDIDFFKLLAINGADINLIDKRNGANLLHFAVFRNKIDIVEFLLNNSKIDFNNEIKKERSAYNLFDISQIDNYYIDLLKKADVNIVDELKNGSSIIDLLLDNTKFNAKTLIFQERSVIDLVSISSKDIKGLFINNPKVEFSDKLKLAENEQIRVLLSTTNANLSAVDLSSDFISWIIKEGDFNLVKRILVANGYRFIEKYSKETKLTAEAFSKKYQLSGEGVNFSCERGALRYPDYYDFRDDLININGEVFILGTCRNYLSHYIIEKGSMVFIK
jgi:hypothetical protein